MPASLISATVKIPAAVSLDNKPSGASGSGEDSQPQPVSTLNSLA